ncbi:MAG: WYL domain-containing protein, partial [Acutalibacteraceae bacterium]
SLSCADLVLIKAQNAVNPFGLTSILTKSKGNICHDKPWFGLLPLPYARDIENGYPVIFRIDRMENVEATNEHFEIPYRDKFSDGEFRKRVLFMYTCELEKVTFEYSGVLEAMLDKVPTAKVIKQSGNTYTMQAEAYGKGLEMWLSAQGNLVNILEI